MTNRQFRTWLVWQGLSLNRPGLQDFYLMQIACEVRRVLAKNPGDIKVSDFRLQFGKDEHTEQESVADREKTAALAQARWIGSMGGVKIRGLNAPHPVDGSQLGGSGVDS